MSEMLLLKALQEIVEGSEHDGRWLDPSGTECDENDPGATWEEFSAEEQAAWLASCAETARKAVQDHAKATAETGAAWAKGLTDQQLTYALYEMRDRGAAVAYYDADTLGTMFDDGREWDDFMSENRDVLEETMCEAARKYAIDNGPKEDDDESGD